MRKIPKKRMRNGNISKEKKAKTGGEPLRQSNHTLSVMPTSLFHGCCFFLLMFASATTLLFFYFFQIKLNLLQVYT